MDECGPSLHDESSTCSTMLEQPRQYQRAHNGDGYGVNNKELQNAIEHNVLFAQFINWSLVSITSLQLFLQTHLQR